MFEELNEIVKLFELVIPGISMVAFNHSIILHSSTDGLFSISISQSLLSLGLTGIS